MNKFNKESFIEQTKASNLITPQLVTGKQELANLL